jgi:hypothetical protein
MKTGYQIIYVIALVCMVTLPFAYYYKPSVLGIDDEDGNGNDDEKDEEHAYCGCCDVDISYERFWLSDVAPSPTDDEALISYYYDWTDGLILYSNGHLSRLIKYPDGYQDIAVEWSHDGSEAMVLLRPRGLDEISILYRYNATSKRIVKILESESDYYGLAYSPVSNEVAIVNNSALFLMEGDDIRYVCDGRRGSVYMCEWSPDGRYVMFGNLWNKTVTDFHTKWTFYNKSWWKDYGYDCDSMSSWILPRIEATNWLDNDTIQIGFELKSTHESRTIIIQRTLSPGGGVDGRVIFDQIDPENDATDIVDIRHFGNSSDCDTYFMLLTTPPYTSLVDSWSASMIKCSNSSYEYVFNLSHSDTCKQKMKYSCIDWWGSRKDALIALPGECDEWSGIGSTLLFRFNMTGIHQILRGPEEWNQSFPGNSVPIGLPTIGHALLVQCGVQYFLTEYEEPPQGVIYLMKDDDMIDISSQLLACF